MLHNKYFRICCLLLSLVLVVNLLPFQAWAVLRAEDPTAVLASPEQADVSAEEAYIIHELEDERTEYSKVYRLSNGLHMAAVYNEPVHYEKDGHWEDIDNTLVTKDGMLRNTAGVWDVSFPQSMSSTNAVTIEKDGYTLSFYMAGQVRKLTVAPIGQEPVSVMAVTASAAQVQTLDLTAEKEAAEHPETVLENTHSRLQYSNVFSNTNVVYDLVSNRVKESIIIGAYDAELQGYQYTLNTGSLTPVLTDSGEILLVGTDKQTVVMTMPAPYLVDNNGEYSYDVTVDLQGAKGVYTLTYTLPTSWMADSSRSYPVVLDPQVEAGNNTNNILDITVCETNAPGESGTYLMVGANHPTYGDMRSYLMFQNLPGIDVTDIVVEATLGLYLYDMPTAGFVVSAHKLDNTWTSGITWENQPGHSDIIEDFNVVQTADTDYEWDVTEIVRDWYLKGNTGLMLSAPDTMEMDTSGRAYILRFCSEANVWHVPTLMIKYRNTVGIESYFTYATLGVGNAGGVYLGDSTGQITAVKQIASYASTVNPFSLNMVYNSAYFVQDDSRVYSPLEAMGLSMTMGNGWTLDVVQKLVEKDIDGTTYLMYYDGDGTVHYFTPDDEGVYHDEDGLGLKVEANDNGDMVMSDDQDNTWTFTGDVTSAANTWFLTSTKDNNENGYSMTYSGGKLTTITQQNRNQTEIVVATLNYPENSNQVESITDATGDNYAFTYSNGNLTNITRRYNYSASSDTYSTNLCGTYTYSGSRMIKMEDNLRKYALKFEYGGLDENGVRTLTTGRVTAYQEVATENNTETSGFRCDISYLSYTHTTYHSYGNDRQKDTADDLYSHYLFDYSGRTVNAYTTDETGTTVLGASTAVYTDNEGISRQNNRMLRTASIGIPAQKIMPRANFEDTAGNWTYSNTADSTSNPRTGVYSLKGTLSASATTAYASRRSKTLTSGTAYSLSAYVNTSDMTAISGEGIYLLVTEDNGTSHKSESLNYITSEDMDDGWIRISMSFTATNTGSATVAVYGTSGTGSFYVDDMQLEKGEAPSNYNLLENGDLQTTNSAYAWTLKEAASFCTGVGVNSEDASAKCIKIEGDPEDQYAYAIQTVQINRSGEQTYVLSGWGKANAVPDNLQLRSSPAYDNYKQFGLRATVYYKGDTNNTYKEYYYVPFNADVTAWQYASLTITPEQTDMVVDHINVSCVYEGNINTAWFDDLSLVCTTVQSYEYDSKGNPVTSSSTNLNDQTIIYDGSRNITSVSSSNITSTYEYDSVFTHRLILSSDGLIETALTHDDVGNVLSTTVSSAVISDAKKMVTSSSYTNAGNLISSKTDAAGNTTTYGYNDISVSGIAASCDTSSAFYKAFGLPSVVADPSGNEMRYVTDTFGRVRQIEAYGKNGNSLDKYASLKYTYGKTLLYEIQRTTGTDIQKYFFLYDKFGNMTDVGIGGWNSTDRITLAEYEYGNGTIDNGLLTGLTYGNEDAVSFTYDNLGRNKTTTYSDGRALTYVYTGDGQLYSIHDSKTGYLYQYTYDSIGRLISGSVKNSAGNILLSTRQEYDASNQLVGQHWTAGSTTYSETYTYSDVDGALTSYNNGLGQTTNLEYDALRRLSRVDTNTLDRYYVYADGEESDQTTGMVSKYWYGNANYDSAYFKYAYTYDVLGNIATYTQNGIVYSYSYDLQNHLTEVLDADGNTLYKYTYDSAGNIRTATSGSTTNSYTYGNALWKDQLTAFNGQTITYDGSGNPLSYYNGTRYTFTWEEGRSLVGAVSDINTVSYAYDQNGLRLSKTVNGVKHEYLYASGKLLRETIYNTEGNVTDTLDFFYLHNGYPYSLKHNGTVYYYITNLQGDVLCMITGDGKSVASYSYDPYGKVLTSTGSMATINPLRYRSYVYDVETGFYYLQSRYYDPSVGRFINLDCYLSKGNGIVGTNMFAYCGNNPVNRMDSTGCSEIAVLDFPVYAFSAAVSALLVSINSAIASIKATIAASWLPALAIVAASVAVASIVYAIYRFDVLADMAKDALALVRIMVQAKGLSKKTLRNHSVYVIEEEASSEVVYVGRTQNFSQRQYNHQRKPGAKYPMDKYNMYVIATGLTLNQARALEETLITAYTIDALRNSIHSIAKSNYGQFMQEFLRLQSLLSSYVAPG